MQRSIGDARLEQRSAAQSRASLSLGRVGVILKIQRDLPMNKPVVIEFTPARSGDIAFACGMKAAEGVGQVPVHLAVF